MNNTVEYMRNSIAINNKETIDIKAPKKGTDVMPNDFCKNFKNCSSCDGIIFLFTVAICIILN